MTIKEFGGAFGVDDQRHRALIVGMRYRQRFEALVGDVNAGHCQIEAVLGQVLRQSLPTEGNELKRDVQVQGELVGEGYVVTDQVVTIIEIAERNDVGVIADPQNDAFLNCQESRDAAAPPGGPLAVAGAVEQDLEIPREPWVKR